MTMQPVDDISLNLPMVEVSRCQGNGKRYAVFACSTETDFSCPECYSENLIGFGTKEQ
jgi:hypothetical protein